MNNNEENPYDNKDPYDILQGWHEKAKEQKEDPYASFVLEYLTFIFYLKKIKKLDENNAEEVKRLKKDIKLRREYSDAEAVKTLKKDKKLREEYLKLIKEKKELQDTWQELINKLEKDPLRFYIPSRGERFLKIESIEDWKNMLDFWRIIRNHLFHAEKYLENRDVFLVSCAYKTLSPLIEEIILKNKLKNKDLNLM